MVELRTGSEARNAPSAYGIFNVIYEGEVVADHPISATRFLNIMRADKGVRNRFGEFTLREPKNGS